MGKQNIETENEKQSLLSNLKSYSIDEIMASGGTTAFANKLGKNPANIAARLEKLPKDSFLTEEEYLSALETLNQSK